MEPIKNNSNSFSKYFVLVVLFMLPLIAYLFFLQGKHHFDTLPVVRENVGKDFSASAKIALADSVSLILFAGEKPYDRLGHISNVNEKAYKKFSGFDTFQWIIVAIDGTQNQMADIKEQMKVGTDIEKLKVVYLPPIKYKEAYNSLRVDYPLNSDMSSDYLYIIDQDQALRGRTATDDEPAIYGYRTQSQAELNKYFIDDMRVLLAEYRFAFKKNRNEKLNDE